jgi:hypothetical protein
VTFNLQIALNGTTITGAATINGSALAVSADRAVYSAKSPAPQALGQKTYAKYTMALPHPITGTGVPQGDGYGTVTVTPAGAVRFTGALGDGTVASVGASLGREGEFPFFFLPPLYHRAGVITGALTITATGTTGSISGNLDWYKPDDKAQYYPAGFTISGAQSPPNPMPLKACHWEPRRWPD